MTKFIKSKSYIINHKILEGKMKKIFTLVFLITLSYVMKAQVTDIDGNVYQTVTIGTQTWMLENLRATHLNDGTPIPYVAQSSTTWSSTYSPAFGWFNNDSVNNKSVYGGLYNGYCVSSGKIAPAGWHVPTDADWEILSNYLGGDNASGAAMMATTLWILPNSHATNSSGFTALPAGHREGNGTDQELGSLADWWESTGTNVVEIDDNNSNINRFYSDPHHGFSIRCVKNKSTDIDITTVREKMTLYPNPASGFVNVITDLSGLIMVTNCSGRMLKQVIITEDQKQFDVSGLPAGYYLISFKSEDGMVTCKLRKE